jgi:hypothetical protein
MRNAYLEGKSNTKTDMDKPISSSSLTLERKEHVTILEESTDQIRDYQVLRKDSGSCGYWDNYNNRCSIVKLCLLIRDYGMREIPIQPQFMLADQTSYKTVTWINSNDCTLQLAQLLNVT